ncbi:MAG: flavodoxin [Dysgonomonas sp.]
MRIRTLLLTILAMSFMSNTEMQAQTTPSGKRILIAYFSWGGNTRNVAEQIKAKTGADIFEIVPAAAYPSNYNSCVEQAKKEVNSNYKPALKTKLANINSYDIIIIGSPNWWSTIAPPVATFLSSYSFSGKTILPFITHEGSRMGRSESDIKKLCPTATLLGGLPIRGSSVKNAGNDIQKWLKDNSVIK